MDRIPVAPLKSSSFSAATSREDKLARNLSLGPIKLNEQAKEESRLETAAGEGADPDKNLSWGTLLDIGEFQLNLCCSESL
ncbi:unnamed protein product [Urochloa humidicola]